MLDAAKAINKTPLSPQPWSALVWSRASWRVTSLPQMKQVGEDEDDGPGGDEDDEGVVQAAAEEEQRPRPAPLSLHSRPFGQYRRPGPIQTGLADSRWISPHRRSGIPA